MGAAAARRCRRLPGGVDRRRPYPTLGDRVEAAEASGVRERKSFAIGLTRDWEAVVAGLPQEWSTGPPEGHVNRVKALKRQMFRRASVDLCARACCWRAEWRRGVGEV